MHVFSQQASGFVEHQRLRPGDPGGWDTFGQYLAASPDTLLVSSHGDNNLKGTNAGSVYVFELDAGS